MRKIGFVVCITVAIALAGCGKTEGTDNITGTPVPTVAENTNDGNLEENKAP